MWPELGDQRKIRFEARLRLEHDLAGAVLQGQLPARVIGPTTRAAASPAAKITSIAPSGRTRRPCGLALVSQKQVTYAASARGGGHSRSGTPRASHRMAKPAVVPARYLP